MPAQMPPALSSAAESASTMIMSTPGATPSLSTPSTVAVNGSGTLPWETVRPWVVMPVVTCETGIVFRHDAAGAAGAPATSTPVTSIDTATVNRRNIRALSSAISGSERSDTVGHEPSSDIRPVTAPAGGGDRDRVAGLERDARLRSQRAPVEAVGPRLAVRAALGTVGRMPPPIGQDRGLAALARGERADPAVPARRAPGAAAPGPERIALDPWGIRGFKRLDGRVERVRHRYMYGRRTRPVTRSALAPADRLVVAEAGRAEG